VQKILETTVSKFGTDTEAGKVGGIRGTDKYVKRMTFIADPATNRIIMRGDYQDYLMVKDLIYQIDQPQPQVAIEVLVLFVSWSKVKQLGTQIRNYMKTCGGFGSDRVQFQTSGLNSTGGIIERQKTETSITVPNRLMGNLLDLVTGLEAGNTIISFGRDIFGVWGLLQLFESFTASETVANPFLIAANKQKAIVDVGEIRRVVTSQIIQTSTESTNSYDDMKASLRVEVTPQINSDGMITLDILVSLKTFLSGFTAENAGIQTREIQTKAIVSDREVLALGGLLQNNSTQNVSKVPGLGDVPFLGWLFKNEGKTDQRDCLLILFSTQIVDPLVPDAARKFTLHHIDDYYGTLDAAKFSGEKHDPIYRMFFEEDKKSVGNKVQDFIFEKPKKRSKKDKAQLEAIKKEHPVLSDQPDVLEAMYGTSTPVNAMVPQDPKATQKAKRKNKNDKRKKVSLTEDARVNSGVSA
jgi:general secretion pathway protein D